MAQTGTSGTANAPAAGVAEQPALASDAAVPFLMDGDVGERPTFLLAHGAGAAMDTPWMTTLAGYLAAGGLRVVRFEFAYMAARRNGGPKRPPPKVETLTDEFRSAIDAAARTGPLFVGGKSMGGRVASLIADEMFAAGRIAGLVCLGYPFHPRNRPGVLRTDHLQHLHTPTLICQGGRDPLGSRHEVQGYSLSPRIALHWLEDGDHDLRPRKRVTGRMLEDHLREAAAAILDWTSELPDI